MKEFKAYKNFIDREAPTDYKNQIRHKGLFMVVIALVFLLIFTDSLEEIPLPVVISEAVLITLTLILYHPVFPILLSVAGAVSMFLLSDGRACLVALGPIIAGLIFFLGRKKPYRLFKAYRKQIAKTGAKAAPAAEAEAEQETFEAGEAGETDGLPDIGKLFGLPEVGDVRRFLEEPETAETQHLFEKTETTEVRHLFDDTESTEERHLFNVPEISAEISEVSADRTGSGEASSSGGSEVRERRPIEVVSITGTGGVPSVNAAEAGSAPEPKREVSEEKGLTIHEWTAPEPEVRKDEGLPVHEWTAPEPEVGKDEGLPVHESEATESEAASAVTQVSFKDLLAQYTADKTAVNRDLSDLFEQPEPEEEAPAEEDGKASKKGKKLSDKSALRTPEKRSDKSSRKAEKAEKSDKLRAGAADKSAKARDKAAEKDRKPAETVKSQKAAAGTVRKPANTVKSQKAAAGRSANAVRSQKTAGGKAGNGKNFEVILGSKKPIGEESFRTPFRCASCGGNNLEVIGTKYNRLSLTSTGGNAAWEIACPACRRTKMIASEEAKKIALLSGEYRTYRKAERSKLWCWLFLLMLLLLIAFASLTLYYVLDQKTVGVSEVQAEDMPKHGRFEGGELEIVDYYSVQSVRGEEWNGDWSDTLSIEALHMLAYLENENGRFLIPVKIPRDAPIFKECIAALADPFRSNVRTEIRGTITALPNKLLHTLHETVRSGNAYYPAYDGLLDDIEIEYRTAAQTNSGPGPLEKRYFLMTAAAGLLGIFCYLMDKRSNGEKKSRKVQRQYDLRRGLVSDNIQGLSSER